MTVRLRGRRGLPRVDRAYLRTSARRILRATNNTRSELSIVLIDDEGIAELNQAYRGIAGPTDVLSFSLLEGVHSDHRGPLLGDVIVSLDTASRQARRARRSLEDEVIRLIIHGTLHLLGHDHEHAEEARVMRAEERRIGRIVHA